MHILPRTLLSATRLLATIITLTLALPAVAAETSRHAAAGLGTVDVSRGFADLVSAVKPAVVNISSTGHISSERRGGGERHGGAPFDPRMPDEMQDFLRRFFGERGAPGAPRQPYQRKTTALGSGFLIDPSGLVVTNHHVIEDADEIEVVFDDGTRIPATLRGHDKKTDLALLKISTDKPLPFVKFGDSDAARVGDWVIAIGNPFGLGGTTTAGIVSARGRDIQSGPLDDYIQIDAPINRGNSGGPLFNTRGEVIGVNSVIFSPTGGSVGIGFAIPSAMAANVIAQLRDSGAVRRGYLGVYIQALDDELADSLGLDSDHGALVTQIIPDSPADDAGIRAGDVILTYDGKPVSEMRDLPKLVALTEDQTRVNIEVWRDERRRVLRAAIDSKREESGGDGGLATRSLSGRLGMTLDELDRVNREKYGLADDSDGVVVTGITPGAAAERGLREGDLIRQINRRPVGSLRDANDALRAVQEDGGETVLMLVEREQRTRFVVVPLNS